MKTIFLKSSLIMVVATMLFTSCEKEVVRENTPLGKVSDEYITGREPDATGEVIRYVNNKKVSYVDSDNAKFTPLGLPFIPKKLTIDNKTWTNMSKDNIAKIGLNTDQKVFEAFTNKYNQVNGTNFFTTNNVTFNNNGSGLYYASDNKLNTHLFQSLESAKWKFSGEGIVTQANAAVEWKPVPNFNTRFYTNQDNEVVNLGDRVWFNQAKTTSKEITIEANGSVKVTAAVKIPFVADGGTEVTLGGSVSTTIGTETTLTEDFHYANLNIPPGKSVRYQFEHRWVPVTTTWKIPIEFRGYFASHWRGSVISTPGMSAFELQTLRSRKLDAKTFNADYATPQRAYKVKVVERMVHDYRIAVYKIGW